MNDTMSLLLATGILAVGGLGLFMYKNSSEEETFLEEEEDNNSKNDESWFDLRSFFGNSDDKDDENDEELEVYETKTKSRGSKTKSVRKTGGTKRRYY